MKLSLSAVFSIPHIWVIISFVVGNLFAADQVFTERFRWAPIKYDFSVLTQKQQEEINKTRIGNPQKPNTVILGISFWKDQTLFMTTMEETLYMTNRNQSVVLGQVDLSTATPDNRSPPVQAFAVDELMNQVKTTSPPAIDACDRLWFVDFLQARLFAVNVKDGKKVRDVSLNTTPGYGIAGITVDVLTNPETGKNDCDNTYVYVPNPDRFEFLVYHFKDDKQWTIKNPSFTYTNINSSLVGDTSFLVTINSRKSGLTSTVLVEEPGNSNNKTMYALTTFMPLMFAISTKTLQNPSATPTSTVFNVIGFTAEKDIKRPIPFNYYDKQTGIIFYSIDKQEQLGCWNSRRFPNVVSTDTTDVLPISDVNLKEVLSMTGDEHSNLWLSQMKEMKDDNQNRNLYSFQMFSAPVANLVQGTKCQPL